MVEDHRLALGGDPPGESLTDRDPLALAYSFFAPGRGGGGQLARGQVQQQHRGGVGLQDVLGPFQQLGQQITLIQADRAASVIT